MLNNDDFENEKDFGSAQEHDSSDKDIPRWLQGFEDRQPEDTQPIAQEEKTSDAWGPELGEPYIGSIGEDAGDIDEHAPLSNSDSEDLPIGDNVDELHGIEDLEEQPGEALAEVNDMVEIPDDISFVDKNDFGNRLEDELPQAIAADDELPSPEGFMDISELDVSELPEQSILDDEPLRQGDLPDWLQEMITEAEGPQAVVQSSPALDDQEMPDEPLEITSKLHDEEVGSMHYETIPEEGHTDFELLDSDETISSKISPEGEETSPLSMPSEEDLRLQTEEEPDFDFSTITEDDPQLEQIQGFLATGNFEEAAPLIGFLLEEESHLELLESWLKEAVESDPEPSSQALEVLGDIAFKQNKPTDALSAYTKAIKQLLTNDEAFNEIN